MDAMVVFMAGIGFLGFIICLLFLSYKYIGKWFALMAFFFTIMMIGILYLQVNVCK